MLLDKFSRMIKKYSLMKAIQSNKISYNPYRKEYNYLIYKYHKKAKGGIFFLFYNH